MKDNDIMKNKNDNNDSKIIDFEKASSAKSDARLDKLLIDSLLKLSDEEGSELLRSEADSDIPMHEFSPQFKLNIDRLIKEACNSEAIESEIPAHGQDNTLKTASKAFEQKKARNHKGIISLFGHELYARSLANVAALLVIVSLALFGISNIGGNSTSTVAEIGAARSSANNETETKAAKASESESTASAPALAMAPLSEDAAVYDAEPESAAAQPSSMQRSMIPNPMKEVSSEADFETELGIKLIAPDNCQDKQLFIIGDSLCEISYTDSSCGARVNYRAAKVGGEDISGVYYSFRDEDELEIDGIFVDSKTADTENGESYLYSFELSDTDYSIYIEDCKTKEQAEDITKGLVSLLTEQ